MGCFAAEDGQLFAEEGLLGEHPVTMFGCRFGVDCMEEMLLLGRVSKLSLRPRGFRSGMEISSSLRRRSVVFC